MSGTAIVYGNGSADDAMASFPPDDNVLQDSFVAVFTGPETDVILSEAEQEEQARVALRNEVQLHVCKATYEEQAEKLMTTNYVYQRHKNGYKPDLVGKLPESPSLPSCFEACAKFIPLRSNEVDVTSATGPAGATTAAQHELDSAEKDSAELDKWLSVLEDDHDEVAEMTSLPALQGIATIVPIIVATIISRLIMALTFGTWMILIILIIPLLLLLLVIPSRHHPRRRHHHHSSPSSSSPLHRACNYHNCQQHHNHHTIISLSHCYQRVHHRHHHDHHHHLITCFTRYARADGKHGRPNCHK